MNHLTPSIKANENSSKLILRYYKYCTINKVPKSAGNCGFGQIY